MQLVSVNIGKQRTIENAKKSGMTGIYKEPVAGPVSVQILGLPGDAVVDQENHGGVDQAVYLYTTPDYEWWSQELGKEVGPGTFGENLTLSGLESADLWVGDYLQVGAVLLQVTAPRIPCGTLSARMGDPGFVKRFRHAERPGAYCRVLQEGTIQAGDPVVHRRYEGENITLLEMFRDFYSPRKDEATLRRYLAAPICIRGRQDKEEQLRLLLSA